MAAELGGSGMARAGSTSKAWMQERAALQLSHCATTEFIAAYADQRSFFPAMASVKVVRRIVKADEASGASRPAEKDSKPPVSLVVVHAADQPFGEPPTQATMELLPLLDHMPEDTSGIVPAALHMAQPVRNASKVQQ